MFVNSVSLTHDPLDHICIAQAMRRPVGRGQCSARSPEPAFLQGGLEKRAALRAGAAQLPAAKRRRVRDTSSAEAGGGRPRPTAEPALRHLRAALQALDSPQRREAILGLAPLVRSALLAFMEGPGREDVSQQRPTGLLGGPMHAARAAAVNPRVCERVPQNGDASAGIRMFVSAHGTQYQAQLHIKALRFYAPKQTTLEAAAKHQAVLLRIRAALRAASAGNPAFWLDHARVAGACAGALRECGSAEGALGLRALVHVRAARWLGQGLQIASPALGLAEAAGLHARLLRARCESWESFRAEWLSLLQSSGYRRRRQMAAVEARAVVDGARRSALQRQLVQAARSAQRVLERASRARKNLTRGRCMTAIGDGKALGSGG
mmetsp:Transcript_129488/g.360718  ORF Transcript_129488/g.360718 Transcript_129488/m.360718 type:complete len:379 (-) Transcript_129488:67-1203(-)